MKPAKACRQCRNSKRKCTEADDSTAHLGCITCQQRNLLCSRIIARDHPVASGPQKLISSHSVQLNTITKHDASLSLSTELILLFVDLYMRYIHDRPHSLFHEKTLLADIQAETVPVSLLAAICAMGCRFSSNPYHCELAVDLRTKASSIFSRELEKISLSNVQTCILLANLYAAEQNNGLEILYFGIANRMAHVLRLHESHSEDPPILREIKCRVWWTLYMADRWCPPGLGLPREIISSSQSVELPKDEVYFQNMDTQTSMVHGSNTENGLWKYKITLADIFGPIQDLNQSLVRNSYCQKEIDQQVARLAGRLDVWANTLPENMKMNDGNLEAYRNNGLGGTFIALHLGYHHYSTLLYFQYLDPALDSAIDAAAYAKRCRYHALCFSRLISSSRRTEDCQVVYLTVAHMTVVSSSVLLHILLFGEDEEEVQTARAQLSANFEALVELKNYWPHMDKITKRLMTFQDACLRFTGTKTYRINCWMVRFLLEHALPFEEKSENAIEEMSVDSCVPPAYNNSVSFERTNMLDEAFVNLYR